MDWLNGLKWKNSRFCLIMASCMVMSALSGMAQTVDFDIIYLRSPRYGDFENTIWPEVFHPGSIEPGTDLMILHPDGSEEVLVSGGNGAIADVAVSFDAKTLFYSKFPDVRPDALNGQRKNLPFKGADLYRYDLATDQETRLTFQEWTPNEAAGSWSVDPTGQNAQPGDNYLGYGILNLGPCPLPNGKLMFTSNRNGYMPNKSYTQVCLQLFIMDQNGGNVEQVGYLNIGSALHPTVLMDGRVMFSSYEAQGLRDRRLWGLWSIWPDGRHWEPLMSAFKAPQAFHFQTQLSNGDIAVVDYYNLNNNGFGTLLAFETNPDSTPMFGSPDPNDPSNPAIQAGIFSNGLARYERYPFSPVGLKGMTPFTWGSDSAAPLSDPGDPNSLRVGKITHPSAAPNNDVLLVWTPGPANDLNRPAPVPYYDAGLYILANNAPATSYQDLILIKNDPNYNENWPRALVPYQVIYGIEQPVSLPFLPNDGQSFDELPKGTPFGLVGSSSLINRNSFPGRGSNQFDGLDPFNTSENGASTNWFSQGAESGLYTDDDIFAIRILAMEPISHRGYGPNGGCCGGERNFYSHAGERLRILGEFPVRKADQNGQPVFDNDGNPDTSFLVKIPADTPFTFQTLDENRMALNMSQTWHQVRPGEARYDCGGCHAHANKPTEFEATYAARADYVIRDLAQQTPVLTKNDQGQAVELVLEARAVDVEYHRDIKPILKRSCIPCHNAATPTAALVLDDETIVDRHENTYNRLARDENANFGYSPVISNGTWRQTNASRYIRKFQSRRSLLVWKVFGRRMDGWSNDDHPSESIPGDPTSLPAGTNPNDADLDFSGSIMPPVGAVDPQTGMPIPELSEDEKMLIATWVDLGCPVNVTEAAGDQRSQMGWFLDDLKPTLTLSQPRAGLNLSPLQTISFGAFDYYSGLDTSSFKLTADFEIDGNPVGTNLSSNFQETDDHVWTWNLSQPITSLASGSLTLMVRDLAGNSQKVQRSLQVYSNPIEIFPLESWRNATQFEPLLDFNNNQTLEILDMTKFLNDLLQP